MLLPFLTALGITQYRFCPEGSFKLCFVCFLTLKYYKMLLFCIKMCTRYSISIMVIGQAMSRLGAHRVQHWTDMPLVPIPGFRELATECTLTTPTPSAFVPWSGCTNNRGGGLWFHKKASSSVYTNGSNWKLPNSCCRNYYIRLCCIRSRTGHLLFLVVELLVWWWPTAYTGMCM